MNFHDLQKVETADTYIDIALKAATKSADEMRMGTLKGNLLQKSKTMEVEKLKIIGRILAGHMNKIIKVFPNFDHLDPFYKELIRATVDYVKLKKSLGAVNWAEKSVRKMTESHLGKIKMSRDIKAINAHRREYYGRVCSIVKQIKKELLFLDDARKIMKGYPNVKTAIPTICICGFPNVGKSTLLAKISSATPEIKNYAFTTKGLNLGYIKTPKVKLQLVDTPGTLNRFEKMNPVEQQADIAIRHLAELIIYVYDLTETYDIKEQKKLLMKIKKTEKPILIYLSKTDLVDKDVVDKFKKNLKDVYTDSGKIKDKLIKTLEKSALSRSI